MTHDDFRNAGAAAAMVHLRHARTASSHEGAIPPSQNQGIFTLRQRMMWLRC
jgi:hypothetical protein